MRSSSLKKRIIQFVLLLIANIVLGGFVGAAAVIYLLLNDPIMAAIPAAIALPGMLLQPWYLAMLFFPPSYSISPIIASFITLGVYWYLNQMPWFRLLRRKLPKISLIRWTVAGLILAVMGGGLMFARFKDFPALKTGVSKRYPYSLRRIDEDIGRRGRFYQLSSFLDKEALWQVKLNESQLEQVIQPLGMNAIAPQDFPDSFNGMPPYWWRPLHHSTTRYFSTQDFPVDQRGPDGGHAIALWNPGDQLFYLWIKDNF